MTSGKNFSETVDRLRSKIHLVTRRVARRETVLAAVILAVPVVALAQPLGLLLWARMRILTSIPRTAMATEEPTRVAVDPGVVRFPDLPDSGLDEAFGRDPMYVSPQSYELS